MASHTENNECVSRVAFVQDGARLHYAFPLALQRRGMLERMFTTWYTAPGSPESLIARCIAPWKPALSRRIAGRWHPGLDSRRIVHARWLLLRERLAKPRAASPAAFFERCAELERDWILRHGFGSANILGGFVRNIHPGLCRVAKSSGLSVIVDQIIAPAVIELSESETQRARWPNWEEPTELQSVATIESQTWAAADHITCASDYVRDGLVSVGVERNRISVNAYPVSAPEFRFIDRTGRDGRPVIGFVGQVSLRKGAPYLLEVAKRLSRIARFVMVGPIAICEKARSQFSGHVDLIGAVPRDTVVDWMSQFDIYCFPSTCEGSAGSVAEAMLTGLPIVTTPNSGSLVRDGIDGFVCAYDDVDRLTEVVKRLIVDQSQRLEMGRRAHERARAYDLDSFADRLATIVKNLEFAPCAF